MPMQIFISKRTAIWQAIRRFMFGEEEGAALVEFTIFAPLLVFMSGYTMDFGLYYYQQMQVQSAAQTAAQYAMVSGNAPSFSSINGYTISSSTNYYCPSSTSPYGLGSPVAQNTLCDPLDSSTIAGKYVTVTTQATYTTLAPIGFFSNSTYPLAGAAKVRVQ